MVSKRPRIFDRRMFALDAMAFFGADIQVAFGAFFTVYLTSAGWTQTDIGLVLSVSGLAAVITQVPLGPLVDGSSGLRSLAALSLGVLSIAALAFAAFPSFLVIMAARLLQGMAAGLYGIVMVALSLTTVGPTRFASRLGRNAGLAALGTVLTSLALGTLGYYHYGRLVFILASLAALPALLALFYLPTADQSIFRPSGSADRQVWRTGVATLFQNRAFVVIAGCGMLFETAYASMLILAADLVTQQSPPTASAMVAGAIVVQQGAIALAAPLTARLIDRVGRRPLLLVAFAAVPMRGLLFALTLDPRLVVLIQVLDGLAIGVLMVAVSVVLADVTADSGYFNLAQGVVRTSVGLGSIVGPTAVGLLADRLGGHSAFLAMVAVSVATVANIALAMPETAPARKAA